MLILGFETSTIMSSFKPNKPTRALTIISTKSICPVRAEPKVEPEPKPEASFAPRSFYSAPPKLKTLLSNPEKVTAEAPKSTVGKPAVDGTLKLGRKKSVAKSPKTKNVEHSIRKPSKAKKQTKKVSKKSPKTPKVKKSAT